MHPPTKDQADIGLDNQTLDASDKAEVQEHDGSAKENIDRARQEFKDEADINVLLSKLNITQPRGAPTYGEWDDTIELQTALQSLHDAREAYKHIPKELKAKFGNMQELIEALENGSLVIKDEPDPTAGTPPALPPAQQGRQQTP